MHGSSKTSEPPGLAHIGERAQLGKRENFRLWHACRPNLGKLATAVGGNTRCHCVALELLSIRGECASPTTGAPKETISTTDLDLECVAHYLFIIFIVLIKK